MRVVVGSLAITGLQPSAESLHLGNYLGVLSSLESIAKEHDILAFAADLHALTTQKGGIRPASINLAATLIACGVPADCVFIQSEVPQHTELSWIINCLAPYGQMSRMTQFKDKSNNAIDKHSNINVGLFAYPALMAADVLLYKAKYVPVGEDQKQHLEFVRDMALLFNKKYDTDLFVIPEPIILKVAARTMSLTDGMRKMSKTDPSEASRINLNDSDDIIINKIKKAKTDSIDSLGDDLDSRPEISNLLGIFSALSGRAIQDITSSYSGFAGFKRDLGDLIVSAVAPVRERTKFLLNDKHEIELAINRGKQKALSIAEIVMQEIRLVVGL